MKPYNPNQTGTSRFTHFERNERVPPIKMVMYCSMAGIGVLFFMLGYIFLLNLAGNSENLIIPKLFSVSTVLVLLSGFVMEKAPSFYQQDELSGLKKTLLGAVALAVAFAFAQIFAWHELVTVQVSLAQENSASTLLFLLSSLHLLHLAGAIAFVSYLFLNTSRAASDQVRSLIYIRDPFRNLQIVMLRTYWRFLVGLWVALYFLFLFSL